MSPLILNRILLLLGIVGIFISGVLSVEHLHQLEIPCTAGGGCAAVAKHPSSYLMGMPVAYFGFGGYILLTALALTRLVSGQLLSRFLVMAGYLGASIGLIASLYLQYISFFKIGATCAWCLSSAIVMVVTFVLYTMLFGKVANSESTGSGFAPKELIAGVVGVSIALAGVTYIMMTSQKAKGNVELVDDKLVAEHLVPEPKSARNQIGPDDAPVTVVEFADLCCPTCRASFPKIHELVAKYPGKVRVVYRHFPLFRLAGHEMASVTAVTAELAASKGKFWDFATAFTAPEEAPKTREGVDRIAESIGISADEITKAIEDENSEPNKRVTRDYTDGINYFSISGTPTYFLVAKGQPTKKLALAGVMALLEEQPYKALVKP